MSGYNQKYSETEGFNINTESDSGLTNEIDININTET